MFGRCELCNGIPVTFGSSKTQKMENFNIIEKRVWLHTVGIFFYNMAGE